MSFIHFHYITTLHKRMIRENDAGNMYTKEATTPDLYIWVMSYGTGGCWTREEHTFRLTKWLWIISLSVIVRLYCIVLFITKNHTIHSLLSVKCCLMWVSIWTTAFPLPCCFFIYNIYLKKKICIKYMYILQYRDRQMYIIHQLEFLLRVYHGTQHPKIF